MANWISLIKPDITATPKNGDDDPESVSSFCYQLLDLFV